VVLPSIRYEEWLAYIDHLIRYCMGQVKEPPVFTVDLEERLHRHG